MALMGSFKKGYREEKERQQAQKELKKELKNVPKEERAEIKARMKTEAELEKRGISGIRPENYEQVNRIFSDLAGNGLLKAGMALSFSNAAEQAKVTYQSALVEQNWILIQQNDQILNQLERLNNNLENK